MPIAAFFLQHFPGLQARHGHLVAAGMEQLNAPALTVEVGGAVWTIFRDGATIGARPETEPGALSVRLSAPQFSDLAQNQMSLNGFLVGRELTFDNGNLSQVSAWDSLWIALLEGWPVVDEKLSFLALNGLPLYLQSTFQPHDDPEEIAHFLRETGYVHLRGWLSPSDMEAVSSEMDQALPSYHEGDGKSWWATVADGSRQCVRLQEFVDSSPTIERILSSDTWDNLRDTLAGADKFARKPVEGRIIEALIKPVGVRSGPSDLSFHRDCHLGRHAYVCSRMTLGLAVTASSVTNGLLQVVAGSHRVVMPVERAMSGSYLPVVDLPTEPGDITVHLSCTLHASTPPLIAERRVLYTEIPLVPREGPDVSLDTSVTAVRERVNDLLRDEGNASLDHAG